MYLNGTNGSTALVKIIWRVVVGDAECMTSHTIIRVIFRLTTIMNTTTFVHIQEIMFACSGAFDMDRPIVSIIYQKGV